MRWSEPMPRKRTYHPSWTDLRCWLFERRFEDVSDRIRFYANLTIDDYVQRVAGRHVLTLEEGSLEECLERRREVIAETQSGHLAVFGHFRENLREDFDTITIEMSPIDHAAAVLFAVEPKGSHQTPNDLSVSQLVNNWKLGDKLAFPIEKEATYETVAFTQRGKSWRRMGRDGRWQDDMSTQPHDSLHPAALLERCETFGLRPHEPSFYTRVANVIRRGPGEWKGKPLDDWELPVGPYILSIYTDGSLHDDRREGLEPLVQRIDQLAESADARHRVSLNNPPEDLDLEFVEQSEAIYGERKAGGHAHWRLYRLRDAASIVVSLEALLYASNVVRARRAKGQA